MAGRLFRDGLLVFVILAMGLPFLVANIGEKPLAEEQEELVRAARHAALVRQDWLGNALASKVVEAESGPEGGLRVRQRFYTFFGLPWGWYEATVTPDGAVHDLETGLTFGG
jgi:hypothetical protein